MSRLRRGPVAISLVAMIDVLMILLVFFMVTSTYLNLDMVPLAGRDQGGVGPGGGDGATPLLVRLAGDGSVAVRGQVLTPEDLATLIAGRLAADPTLDVVVLPSGAASVQALAAVMDAARGAGAPRLRIVRLEAVR